MSNNLVSRAMLFAQEKHFAQRRDYSGAHYITHLAEVAALTHAFGGDDLAVAGAWLHDCIEDQGVTRLELVEHFGEEVATIVFTLSDMETGNRVERLHKSCIRLAAGCARVHLIKTCDIISNARSIAHENPDFAPKYLSEKVTQLNYLSKSPTQAVSHARLIIRQSIDVVIA